jgi:hypothetical protein
LKFTDERYDITQYASTVTLGYSWPSRVSVTGSVGAIFDGQINGSNANGSNTADKNDIAAGIVGSVAVAKQWTLGGANSKWFATGTIGFAMSRASTAPSPNTPGVSIVASDLRVGALVGRTFGRISPYLLTRAFGGPVFWTLNQTDATGTDVYHVQVGAGVTANLGGGVSAMVDVSALGEQAASLALSLQL